MRNNDTPSMDNIYNSKFYSETKAYEQSLSDDYYKKAQMPFQSGVIPHYFTNDDMNPTVIKSLSGNNININDFKHGNMQPFIKKGVTQNVEQFGLNKNMGYSSDTKDVSKIEIEKTDFFTNQPFYNDTTIDTNNFLASRTNLTKLQNNVSPIQSVLVGPGLNRGFSSIGIGGFQQAETINYVKPKSKEELRPLSDQRSSLYTLPMKPKNNVEQRGVITPMNKNRSERSFNQTEDNWFKGQSVIKKEVGRPEENLTDTTARNNSHINYYGPLKNQDEFFNKDDDYGKNNIIIYDNERNLTQIETPVANFSSVIKAVISPITDALKITMKEFFVDNPRINGNAMPQLPEKATLYDPVTHTMKTTIKETTIHEGNNGNMSGMDETYTALYDTAKTTTKETTIHEGNGGVLSGIDETYSALYDTAKTTTKETTIHEGNGGVLSGIDETYAALYDIAKTTTKETTIHEGNGGTLSGIDETYAALYDTAKTTTKETTIHEGNGGTLSGADETYAALYDTAKTTIKETMIHEGNGGFMEGKQSGYVNNNNKARTTLKETIPYGGTVRNINKISYYSTYVYDPSIVAKKTVKETTVGLGGSGYGFFGGFLNSLLGGYLIKDEKAKNTQRQNSLTDNYGIAGSKTIFTPTDREADYNAEIDGTRELIMMKAGRTPNAGGKFVGVPKEDINMNVNKRQIDLEESARIGNMGTVYEGLPAPIDKENITKEKYQTNAFNNRLDSSILSSLIDNDNIIKINPIRTDCDNSI
uniref:Uncharacterized protein n=1 Tax=viral metagenome TaxID=1070528 RepID=A0A6C0EQM3_9ZZZZ